MTIFIIHIKLNIADIYVSILLFISENVTLVPFDVFQPPYNIPDPAQKRYKTNKLNFEILIKAID